MTWIQTYTGKVFDFRNLTPDAVEIEDISYGLSNICRFTGHCERFYSVAEHSVRVSKQVEKDTGSAWLAFIALLHDATEAYCGDVATPLKQLLPKYKDIEDRIWRQAIAPAFHLPLAIPAVVKIADTRMLVTEKQQLMKAPPMKWNVNEDEFPPYRIDLSVGGDFDFFFRYEFYRLQSQIRSKP